MPGARMMARGIDAITRGDDTRCGQYAGLRNRGPRWPRFDSPGFTSKAHRRLPLHKNGLGCWERRKRLLALTAHEHYWTQNYEHGQEFQK